MNISWLVDKRVIFVDIGTRLTMTDLMEMNEGIIEFLDISDAPKVHIVFRATELADFPVTFSSLSKVFTLIKHPKLGWSVTINNNRLLKLIATMINNTVNRRTIKYVDTYEEVKDLLQSIDPSLTELPDSLE